MEGDRLRELQIYYRDRLVHNTMRFWSDHGIDNEQGGFFTFLDRAGNLLDSDKGVWIQGRATWMYAKLYNEIEKRPEWLNAARHGAAFVLEHCFDSDGRMFFIVTRDGRPVRKRRYAFSEVFAAMGLAEYAKASGDGTALDRARNVAFRAHELMTTPGLLPPKVDPRTRVLRSHGATMIQINMFQVLRSADPSGNYDARIDAAIGDLFRYFVKPERQALFETVGGNGELIDSPSGRCLNPGHAIESSWFLMEEARRRRDLDLQRRALQLLDWALERGWDSRHGGIFYFVDVDGKQAEQLEWDMKLWWVHSEAIYASLLAHHVTDDRKYAEWFERIRDWSLSHFPDEQYGEWFGYLHRDGSVALDFKANHWKGPFHLPRYELMTALLLDEMISGNRSHG